MSTTAQPPLVLGPGDGERIAIRENVLVVKAVSARITAIDYTAPAGFPGPPLHVHPAFDEVFVVLEGTLALRIGEDVHELPPGATAYVPGDVWHTFANPSASPVRFLATCTPGGFEDYFRALAAGDEAAAAAVLERSGYATGGPTAGHLRAS
jgi:mannose-6-phosphate isomerase-like protein (cupin superfamily)